VRRKEGGGEIQTISSLRNETKAQPAEKLRFAHVGGKPESKGITREDGSIANVKDTGSSGREGKITVPLIGTSRAQKKTDGKYSLGSRTTRFR